MCGVGLLLTAYGLNMHYCMIGSFWCNWFNFVFSKIFTTVLILQDSFTWTLNLRTVIVTADIHPGLQQSAWYNRTAVVWPSGIGQVSPPIHPLASSQGAVFLINSCQRYFSCGPKRIATSGQALFRSYGCFFAEFLGDFSLVRLGLLALITCVGLRYGSRIFKFREFSWKGALKNLAEFPQTFSRRLGSSLKKVSRIYLRHTLTLRT